MCVCIYMYIYVYLCILMLTCACCLPACLDGWLAFGHRELPLSSSLFVFFKATVFCVMTNVTRLSKDL